MVPFVLSVFVYYLVSPVAELLESRLRFPRAASTLVVLLLVAGGIFLLGLLVTTSAQGLGNSADIYPEKLLELVAQLATALDARGINLSQDALLVGIRNLPVSRVLQASAGTAFSLLTNGTLVVLFAFGLDLALVFGVLAYVLNFIPSVGSIVATILPLPIALVQFETLGPVFAILALTTGVQMIVGNGIDPMLMGEKLDLSPVGFRGTTRTMTVSMKRPHHWRPRPSDAIPSRIAARGTPRPRG